MEDEIEEKAVEEDEADLVDTEQDMEEWENEELRSDAQLASFLKQAKLKGLDVKEEEEELMRRRTERFGGTSPDDLMDPEETEEEPLEEPEY